MFKYIHLVNKSEFVHDFSPHLHGLLITATGSNNLFLHLGLKDLGKQLVKTNSFFFIGLPAGDQKSSLPAYMRFV